MLILGRKRILLCLLLLNTVCSYSQSISANLNDTLQIDEVTVIAEKIKKEIAPVQSLQGENLKKLSVYSVADAIRYFSGVQVKDYGGIGGLKTVNIRSLGSHHVGVFYDGVQLGNAQNGVVDLGRFSLDNMEAITMYNGQKSAIFQSAKDYASASAIYMRTKRPIFESGEKYNLNISLKGGSFATINPSVLWEHKISDKLSLHVSSEFLYTSGRYKFSYSKKDGYDTTEVRKNGDVKMVRVEAALFKKIRNGEFMTKGYFYNSQRGYPGASVREEPGKFKHQDRQWDNNFFVQSSLRKGFGDKYNLLANFKYAYDYLHYLSDPRLDVTTMYINNYYRQKEIYGSLVNLFSPFKWGSVSLSSDFQWNTLNANLVDFVYPDRYSILNAIATSLDFKQFKFQASLLHTYVTETTKVKGAQAADKSVFTPSVVMSWQPFKEEKFNVRAFYKKIFRMPTLNDLYYTFIGNKYLKPEYTTQYNLGITYVKKINTKWLNLIEFQLDTYFNQVNDKIIAMPTSNQFRWTMLNLGYVEIRGLEASLQGNIKIEGVSIIPRINYTYQKAQDFTSKTSKWYGGQIPYIPWHSGTFILSGSYESWEWNYSFIYTGERYEAVANIPENYSQPWYTHDIALTKNFNIKNTKMRVTVEVNNLLNQQYEVVQCYPMPGINFRIKINIML